MIYYNVKIRVITQPFFRNRHESVPITRNKEGLALKNSKRKKTKTRKYIFIYRIFSGLHIGRTSELLVFFKRKVAESSK